MNGSFLYILICLAAVAFCSFSMYQGAESSVSRFAFGAILLASLAVPFISAFSSALDFEFSAEDFSDGNYSSDVAQKTLEDAFCKGIKYAVSDKFSINSKQITVECHEFNAETLKAEKIKIILSGNAVYSDVRSIKSYIEDENFGECEVILEFE